jgi:hypothetical protein
MNLAYRDITNLAAVLIGDAIDEHKELLCAIYEKIFLTLRARQEGVKQRVSSKFQVQSLELKSKSGKTEP